HSAWARRPTSWELLWFASPCEFLRCRVSGVGCQVSGAGVSNLRPDTWHPAPSTRHLAFQRLRSTHDLRQLVRNLRLPGAVIGALQQLDDVAGIVGRV